jgi:hypothetical protein
VLNFNNENNDNSTVLIFLNWRNGQFCAQRQISDSTQAEYLSCDNLEVENLFKDIYNFMYSSEDTGSIAGVNVFKKIAKSTKKKYFEIDFKLIKFSVYTPKDPQKSGVIIRGRLPFAANNMGGE